MDEVEDRRRAGNLLKREGVARGRGLQVEVFHGHAMDLSMAQRGMLQQAFAHVREVSIRVSHGGHTLVYLDHVDALPWDFFAGQGTEHEPRSMAATNGHDEAAARGCGRPSLCGDDRRCPSSDRIGIGQNFNLHERASNPDWAAPVGLSLWWVRFV